MADNPAAANPRPSMKYSGSAEREIQRNMRFPYISGDILDKAKGRANDEESQTESVESLITRHWPGLVPDHRIRHLPPYYDPDILYDSIRILCRLAAGAAVRSHHSSSGGGRDQISPFFRSLCALQWPPP